MGAPSHVVVIAGGAEAERRYRLTDTIVVGRSPDCAISIDDRSVSRRHFEIVPESDGWRVRDLGSHNGITVNGREVQEAVVRAGDEIRAGNVVFRLEDAVAGTSDPIALFPAAEPALSAEAPPPGPGTLLAGLRSNVAQDPSRHLYALIDGAQAFDVAFTARLMGHRLYTIFSGELAEAAANVGPTLVVVGEPSAFLRTWVERAGSHAGVLLESSSDVDALWAHLRQIFIAT